MWKPVDAYDMEHVKNTRVYVNARSCKEPWKLIKTDAVIPIFIYIFFPSAWLILKSV